MYPRSSYPVDRHEDSSENNQQAIIMQHNRTSSSENHSSALIHQLDVASLVGEDEMNIFRGQPFENYTFAHAEPTQILYTASHPVTVVEGSDFLPHFANNSSVGPLYPNIDYGPDYWGTSSHLSINSDQLPLSQDISTSQIEIPYTNGRDNPYHIQSVHFNAALIHSDLGVVPGQITRLQLQREFLQFLMENQHLLNYIPWPTLDAMAIIEYAFKEDIQRRHFIPLAEVRRIFQQFKPVIGSSAIRHESDNRMTQAIKIRCPFQFCGSYFTRLAGLKNHLSAHFSLTPQQCPHCGKLYSDASFKRHEGGCRGAVGLT